MFSSKGRAIWRTATIFDGLLLLLLLLSQQLYGGVHSDACLFRDRSYRARSRDVIVGDLEARAVAGSDHKALLGTMEITG